MEATQDKSLKPDRRTVRLQNYNYTQPGFYWVTICTDRRICHFGTITACEMYLNDAGKVVQSLWEGLPQRFRSVALDQYIIMPNHIHGIVRIIDIYEAPDLGNVPERFREHQENLAHACQNPPLKTIIRSYKGAVTHEIHASLPSFAWQGSFYDHIIRSKGDLERIRRYMANNPRRWNEDRLYTAPE